MGSEDTGIDQRLLALADEQVKIPILGKIESLNVSVAAGLLIYEVVEAKRIGYGIRIHPLLTFLEVITL